MRGRLSVAARVLLAIGLVASIAIGSSISLAAGTSPASGQTATAAGAVQGGGGPPALNLFRTINVNGGYVAAGVGMRNLGRGSISLKGIPAGAQIYAAYLYWNVLARRTGPALARGTFAGHGITGSLIGQDDSPCWQDSRATIHSYSYRTKLTNSWIRGNRNYALTGFASGLRDGSDPFSWDHVSNLPTPLMEGATLVVVYTKASYPPTTIKLYDGAKTLVPMGAFAPEVGWVSVDGFVASNPTGPTRLTLFGGDGDAAPEPASIINGNPIPAADWDGTDPRNPPAGQGNLWDTATASVGQHVPAGSTSALVQVSSGQNIGQECLVWEGLVFSTSDGTRDTDGDSLPDAWEANGHNGVNLPAMGASPFHKDVFVEVDWMGPAYGGDVTHKPVQQVTDAAVAMFNKAPIPNPDGRKGIKIHVDTGQLGGGNVLAHQEHLGMCSAPYYDYDWTQFDAIKATYFAANRQDIFHYAIFAHDLCSDYGSISGLARNIPSSDFIVSLGSWPGGTGGADAETGTFIHELGHNLGLRHGGNDDVNYKPNYLSLMNYSFQVVGLYKNGHYGIWDYSWTTLPSLDEYSLNENVGLNGGPAIADYGTVWYCPNESRRLTGNANGPIDWNCNGSSAQSPVQANINADHSDYPSNTQNIYNILETQDNWDHITYDGGTIGAGAKVSAPEQFTNMKELSYQEAYPIIQAAQQP